MGSDLEEALVDKSGGSEDGEKWVNSRDMQERNTL